jgi:DNA-binding Xre family transcriptional regulator
MADTKATWREIRGRRIKSEQDEKDVAAERRLLEFEVALNELRRRRSLSQASLAEALGVTQENVSRIERQGDIALSTLDRYIAGLGGKLEIRAVFEDEDVKLTPA